MGFIRIRDLGQFSGPRKLHSCRSTRYEKTKHNGRRLGKVAAHSHGLGPVLFTACNSLCFAGPVGLVAIALKP